MVQVRELPQSRWGTEQELPEGAGLLLLLQSPALPSFCPRNTTQRRSRLRDTTLLCHVQSAWLRGC